MQYDTPVAPDEVNDSLAANPNISDATRFQIEQILGTNQGGGSNQVVVGQFDGTTIQAPQDQPVELLVIAPPPPPVPGQLVQIQIPTQVMQNAQAYVFQTSENIQVVFNTVERVIVMGSGSDEVTVNGDANTTLESGGGNDTLITSGGDDLIRITGQGNASVVTGAGSDTIVAGAGNDTIDAGSGLDVVEYLADAEGYTISLTDGSYTIEGSEGTDQLTNVERLFFSDKKIALDVAAEQNAGRALQMINVVAAELLDDAAIIGLILSFADAGFTLEDIAQRAIDEGWVGVFAGSDGNEDLAKMAFRNVFGTEATADDVDWVLSYMDGRLASFSQAELLAVAAGLEQNNDTIDLVGLQQTGVEYIEFLG